MARASKTSVLKRQRERKKAEKAELKREMRKGKEAEPRETTNQVATRDDLEGYGLIVDPDEEAQPNEG